MNSSKKRVLDSQEEYLKSKLLLGFVKKCITRPEVSPDLKVKILSIIHEGNHYLDQRSFESLNNILGIDDDLINKPSELLTGEQAEELRKFLLIEMRAFHSYCNSITSEIKQPPNELSTNKAIVSLQSIISDLFSSFIELVGNLQEIKTLKADADTFLNDRTKEVISVLKKRMLDERQLFDKIAEAMTTDGRGKALEEVEQILESRINKNQERIEQLKFELREYHAIDDL